MEKEVATKAENASPADYAIKVNGVSKTFRIPHEKISSLRGAFVNAFRSHGYEEFKALDNVSFEVKKGEFFGIIGRNGSGKSTLLKILAGIYQPDGGKVRIRGRVSPFLELGIGFNPELSGRDNIFLNATVLGLTQKQIEEKFDDIVEFSELRRFIDQKVKNYSSGMQVRLAFSVAVHANREILLMDEVLAVGDTNFQSKCFEEFNKYRDQGKTVILVTHDTNAVRQYCERAMLIRNGKIEMVDDAEKVTNKYIYQNMSDEEKRMLDEEKRRLEEEKRQSKKTDISNENNKEKAEIKQTGKDIHGIPIKEKVAQILAVNLSDEAGKAKNVFKTNEIINIKVSYKISRDLSNPIFGLIINDSNKRPIFVTNTEFKKIKTGVIKKGITEVEFILENNLAEGLYYISPAIAGEGAKVFYDWRDNFKTLKIVNPEYRSGGLVDFKHTINIKSE